ncbi:allantoate amidohydrolase [Curtobacterium sp. MCBD17_028]|uniref:allantoate amidohydrolase n=1 Tax=Curtobacterium sp. MCBD17_028 TaxID=2175670 RepID=UPI000DA9662F|nr:allantoate amidohydrolase [Curtobacterium sp. MCBD17_028]PZE22969.1 allantoate amidohydrolase [Curtobacterium sp. MCBD17_028]
MTTSSTDAVALLRELDDIGRDPVRGGHSRHLLDDADRAMRAWFVAAAEGMGLRVEVDGNANVWATWDVDDVTDDLPAVVTGSHLDSVPGGGAYDGPLGVVTALAAVARLQADAHRPSRPLRVVVFAEEEGARFGVACLGSGLMTGAVSPERARALTDPTGVRLADAFTAAGLDPGRIGPDPDRLAGIAAFLELHVEQGRQLAPLDASVGLATTILAHGRWSVRIEGRGDHAGATELADRRDPVLVAAEVVRGARARSLAAPAAARARATVGRIGVVPGGTNAIASSVTLSLDARAEQDADVRALVDAIGREARSAAAAEGCVVEVAEESFSPRVAFDTTLTDRMATVLGEPPRVPTGAGHDAGVLSAHVPTGMLFVRNPDGVSHAPGESASDDDVRAGVDALVAVLRELT